MFYFAGDRKVQRMKNNPLRIILAIPFILKTCGRLLVRRFKE